MKWWHFPLALLAAFFYFLLAPLWLLAIPTILGVSMLTSGTSRNWLTTFYGRRKKPGRLPYKTPSSLTRAKHYESGFARSTGTSNGRS